MYNLLIGFSENIALGSRVFEYTDAAELDYVRPNGALNIARVLNLPALVMREIGDPTSPPLARVGRIISLQRSGSDYRFTFVQNAGFPALSTRSHRFLGSRPCDRRVGAASDTLGNKGR